MFVRLIKKRDGVWMYLEKEAIDYFKNYDLKESFLMKLSNKPEGFFSSRRIGSSAEFEEYKEYVPSDNLKDLDWKKYARTQKLLVRQYESYAHSRIYFFLDISNSMNFPTRRLSKLEYSKKFIAIFSYLLLKNQNEVYFVAIGERSPTEIRIHYDNIEKVLAGVEIEKRFHYSNLLKIKADGIAFLISDGWWGKDFQSVIDILVSKKINFFQVLSAEEIDFPYRDFSEFIDSEKGSKVSVDISNFSRIYRKRMTERINMFYDRFSNYSLYYYTMNDKIPYYHSLKNFLDIAV
ncbi:MAG: DUF58 domain-containing protein [Brevinematia bacterium]